MGHEGMLYSLPSRELIADSVEYMVNAHCADAMVCISNCDKITPGMLMAALRLNIPVIFVSGGPMESGKMTLRGERRAFDLIDAMVVAADDRMSDQEVAAVENAACPTCGSCSGMFTANSMNCLTEALGLALPGNGSLLATHALRGELFLEAGRQIVALCRRFYEQGDGSVLPRAIATRQAFENAMAMDIAMGGPPIRSCICWLQHMKAMSVLLWRILIAYHVKCRCYVRLLRQWKTFIWKMYTVQVA